ncbi:MAG: O-antigen ligase family protein [Cyclobacteriaceae bacterium]
MFSLVYVISLLKKYTVVLFFLISSFITVLIVWKGPTLGILFFLMSVGIPVALVCFVSKKWALLIIVGLSSFGSFFSRIVGRDLPMGSLIDALLLCTALGIIILGKHTKIHNDFFRNPVNIAIFIWILYFILQAFNPEGSLNAWVAGFRGLITFMVSYFILFETLDSLSFIKRFTQFWLAICVLGAIYCFYQEIFGLPPYDLRWVTANEIRKGLNWIQGDWRKWSFFSDVALFGMIMAFGAIFCFVLSTGPYSLKRRILLVGFGLMMIMSMIFSGTRGAYAMIPAGFIFFVLATLNNKRTLAVAIVTLTGMLLMIFGPFYSGPINRIRSTFEPSEDPSMIVREENRQAILPYVYENPMGGGVRTSGTFGERFAPDHPLAGYPPDSAYFETTLETGWIGLIIQLGLYCCVLLVGIRNYYRTLDKEIKVIYLAYLSAFFALTIAAFVKKAVEQFPLGFIVGSIYILMPNLIKFDYKVSKKHNDTPL